ncbi:LytTR family transcriptional regulator [Cerasibacillus terrae]|uniref:LytTR family transcriptional regulator n=1 Tax=Cerasibacillus terrae TaxID=2498845 RepID=A0A5C8NWY5_9BACI|nr:LytTR family DNA-binding domain-containing protein [Cerasibacillus terrae]TXL65722.1 LytTR family transcriptional regulator [Cerasibacillus terrae]
MKVNIEIDEKYKETCITIQTNEWTEELEEIIQVINRRKKERLFGVEEEQTVLLDPNDIDFVYAQKRKVFASCKKGDIEIKKKLYEVEEILVPHGFMRFSKSVIGNLNQIQRFELSFNGNLCVYFHSGNKEYITRKFVAKVKEKLEMGGK